MSTLLPSPEQLVKSLADHLSAEMRAAAEPLIERAVEEVRVALRKRVAEMVVGLISSNYAVERLGTDLRIHVRLAEPTK